MDHDDWDSSSSTDGLDVCFDGDRGSMMLVVLLVSFVGSDEEEDVVNDRMMENLPKGDAGLELALDNEKSLELAILFAEVVGLLP